MRLNRFLRHPVSHLDPGRGVPGRPQSPEAAREFQKLLDHQGSMIGDPVSALAHYDLARAYALSDDTNNARE